MLYLPLDKLVQQGNAASPRRGSASDSQMVDRIANEVIEKLQRNSDQIQSERRR